MGASKDFLCISLCHVWNVCVHVCKTTNWRFICLIICNCIYIVVINCGWNNNVAVKIVACWNWNIHTSSWLDRHGEFVLTITLHVRCESLNRRESCQIVHPLSKSVCARPIWFRPLKLTFSNNNRSPGQWVTLHMQVKSEFLQLLLKKQANRLHS